MICPHCHMDTDTPAPLQVTPQTVVDIIDVWFTRPNGRWQTAVTKRIPIVCVYGSPSTRVVQSPESGRFAASSPRDPLVKRKEHK